MSKAMKWINRKNICYLCFIFLITIMVCIDSEKVSAGQMTTANYTVGTTTKPLNIKYTGYKTYNRFTRHYYMLRSYLEQLEKDGGGTLTITAGTYKISNTLNIPSNVTIYLEDGVVLKKLDSTGVTGFKSSTLLFQMVSPSKATVVGAYSGYNGEKNINLIGKGTATIDLNFAADCIGIRMGHNQNVRISGINFQNMNNGHFIELDASQNVTIENNSFQHFKATQSGIKEAINIDTPDINTDGFHAIWTSYDCTPDKNILIQKNVFEDLERAIGTHKYSQGKYHEDIQLLNNRISNTTSDAIRIMNWLNPVIKDNEISNVAGGKGKKRAILASGVINPTITKNTLNKVSRPIQIMPWKNTDAGSQYAITDNQVSFDNIMLMLQNKLSNVEERFIRVNKEYGVYATNTVKYYYSN